MFRKWRHYKKLSEIILLVTIILNQARVSVPNSVYKTKKSLIVWIQQASKNNKKIYFLKTPKIILLLYITLLQYKKLSIGAWLSVVDGRLMAKSLTLNFSISKTIWWIVLNFHMTLFLTMLISILSSMNLLHYWFLCYFRFMVKQSFGLCSLLLRWIFLKLGRSLPWFGWNLKRFFIIILYFRFSRSRCVATHQ